MQTLADLEFWTTADNNTGLKNITGTELAALMAASGSFVNPHAGKGAGVRRDTTISIVSGFTIVPDFDELFYDDLNFSDIGGANPERLTIPDVDPPITRVQLTHYSNYGSQSQAGFREMRIAFNGSQSGNDEYATVNRVPNHPTPGSDFNYTYTGPPVNVVAGDFFNLRINQNSGVNMNWRGHLFILVLA